MNKRVLIIFSNYDDLSNPFYGGGGAVAIHETAKRLAKNADVMVITSTYPGSKDETIDGVRYTRIGTNFLGPKIGQLVFSFILPFVARNWNYDVWYESLTPPFSCSLLPVLAKGPVVAIAHMLSGEDMRRKYKIPFHVFERFGLRLYRKFIVLSESVARRVRTMNVTAEIEVIPNGIDSGRAMKRGAAGNDILFIGRLEIDQKGLDLLLGAWGSIADSVGCSLVIAGSGNKREERRLRRLISEKRLETSVRLVGRVDENAKWELYRDARFVVIPSRFETFSLVALESFSCGLPVIVFDIEHFSWMPESCALKVVPYDVKGYAEAMMTLHSDVLSYERMSSAASVFASRFDWDMIANRYLRHAKKIVDNV